MSAIVVTPATFAAAMAAKRQLAVAAARAETARAAHLNRAQLAAREGNLTLAAKLRKLAVQVA